MPFEFGDVILVRFPFGHQSGAKQRPAVVVSNRAYNDARPDVVAMGITSAVEADSIPVADWKAAGLVLPSSFKPSFATFEQTLIQRRLGVLSADDKAVLRKLIRDVLG